MTPTSTMQVQFNEAHESNMTDARIERDQALTDELMDEPWGAALKDRFDEFKAGKAKGRLLDEYLAERDI